MDERTLFMIPRSGMIALDDTNNWRFTARYGDGSSETWFVSPGDADEAFWRLRSDARYGREEG